MGIVSSKLSSESALPEQKVSLILCPSPFQEDWMPEVCVAGVCRHFWSGYCPNLHVVALVLRVLVVRVVEIAVGQEREFLEFYSTSRR